METPRPTHPYSYHIFLFPFTQDNLELNENWKPELFSPLENVEDYNKHSYFYDFAEDCMFNTNKGIVKVNYFTKITSQSLYVIETLNDGTYELVIDKIILKQFNDFGVGVLGFYLANYSYSDSSSILKINEFGRRIYPQFLKNDTFVTETKISYLPNRIILKNLLLPDIIEDFSSFESPPFKNNYLPNHITQLIENDVKEVLDDRMFVCCFYGNFSVSDSIKKGLINSKHEVTYEYINNDFWYSYLFVDKANPTCQSLPMRQRLILEATNDRWVDYGTFYGVTRYSFMVLVNDHKFKKLKDDLINLYAEMAMLCLTQRATLLKFSYEITPISKSGIESKEVTELYRKYIEFRNRMYFREITAQEQGIELYDILKKQMRLENEVKNLDEEIAELNNFIQSQEQGTLTKVATLFLPASLMAAILTFISDKDYFKFEKISFSSISGYEDITYRYICLLIIVMIGFFIGHIISNPFKANIKRPPQKFRKITNTKNH